MEITWFLPWIQISTLVVGKTLYVFHVVPMKNGQLQMFRTSVALFLKSLKVVVLDSNPASALPSLGSFLDLTN